MPFLSLVLPATIIFRVNVNAALQSWHQQLPWNMSLLSDSFFLGFAGGMTPQWHCYLLRQMLWLCVLKGRLRVTTQWPSCNASFNFYFLILIKKKQKIKPMPPMETANATSPITSSSNDSTHEEHEVRLARPTIKKRGHGVAFASGPGCCWESA